MKFCDIFWHRWKPVIVNRYLVPLVEDCKCCTLSRGVGVEKIEGAESKVIMEYWHRKEPTLGADNAIHQEKFV